MSAACILGCAGPRLSVEETRFFRDADPWGFILFGRNVEDPDQVRALTAELRAAVGRIDTPILIDQEGGRVQRLGPPHWRRYPPAATFAALGPDQSAEQATLGARLIAHDLRALGIDVDCAPVLDVPAPGAHDIIGDRAYASSAVEVARLGRAVAEGLLAGAVLPVIKHVPGHGRATADSHLRLPVVAAGCDALRDVDFAPFKALSDMPAAMTAHVVYAAFDGERPATTSPVVIEMVIRGEIGFDGLLISDDLSMKALAGGVAERARAARSAGCDIVLHCNGALEEMRAVTGASGELSGPARRRADAALARIASGPDGTGRDEFDAQDAGRRFEAAFGGRRAA